MYQAGQQVVYGIHGVCTVTNIETKIVDRKKIPYYVLEPVDQPGACYYVPTEKPAAVAKMNPLLTVEEWQTLVSEVIAEQTVWINDENQRKLRYRELIGCGDRRAILNVVKALYTHKRQQAELGKKFHLCDENFLRDGERLLCSEMSVIMNISTSEALNRLRTDLDY